MEKAHDYKKLEEAKKDALGVRQAMVNDFKDHFNYCPVYYYIDTNLALIKNREFDGVLLDADGTPAKNIVINSTSTDYMIVYYGSPASQPRYKTTVTDSVRYTYNSGEPIAKGLVINNYKFRQVSYLYRLGFNNFFFTNNSKHSKNAYESKHFDMEYFPTASRFNEFIWQSDRVPIRAVGGGIDTVSYQ